MEKRPITREGFETLRKELEHLKRVVRPQIIAELSQAREYGDLSENAEYHAAKEKQGFIESKIRHLEDKLARAQIIDTAKLESDRVVFGATVVVVEEGSTEEKHYRLVGEDEANFQEGKISIMSPLARALLGKEVGDVVQVQAPKGVIEYEIVDIYFS
ncbi:MAG: transcription elongation factor GreA [Nitrospinota bacterium]|nr:MAG: transcription elongation factor GreA [Nitrospinota bacterium]